MDDDDGSDDDDRATEVDFFLGRRDRVVGIEVEGTGLFFEVGERQTIYALVEAVCEASGRCVCDRLWSVGNGKAHYVGPVEDSNHTFAGAACATVRSVVPSVGDVAFFSYDNLSLNPNTALCFRLAYEVDRDHRRVYPRLAKERVRPSTLSALKIPKKRRLSSSPPTSSPSSGPRPSPRKTRRMRTTTPFELSVH
mmetsp:Transcript_14208/g.42982  ORF Transcript_14208/g.42982 Transcript_14208/m.42982 type:complete len:195 (-) Transcript_14208:706-1290(-)